MFPQKLFSGTFSVRFANLKLVRTVTVLKLLANVPVELLNTPQQNVLQTWSEHVFQKFRTSFDENLKTLKKSTQFCKNVQVFTI